MSVDLAAIRARYVKALASKPGKGDPTPKYVQALEDSVADIKDLLGESKSASVQDLLAEVAALSGTPCDHYERMRDAVAKRRDLVSRLGFGDGITEPMADNDTIIRCLDEVQSEAADWRDHESWRTDCMLADHPEGEDCDEHDPHRRLEAQRDRYRKRAEAAEAEAERLRKALRVTTTEMIKAARKSPYVFTELQLEAVAAERDQLRAKLEQVRGLAEAEPPARETDRLPDDYVQAGRYGFATVVRAALAGDQP